LILQVSTFYCTRYALGETYKMLTFEIFCKQLTCGQEKLLHMGVLDIGSKKKASFSHNNKGVEHSTHPKKSMPISTFWVPLDLLH
jgi:hypothetical protein